MRKPKIGVYWSGKERKFFILEEYTNHEVTDEEFFNDPTKLACEKSMKNQGYIDAIIGVTRVAEKTQITEALQRLDEMKQIIMED
tara:strand:- start:22936 stop:23190 length:255 start_codon:yes stop_codon:yes gene_type:complete